MLVAALAAFAAIAVFLLGFGVALRLARRRLAEQARRAGESYDELERRFIKLGAGIGIGA